MSDTKAVLLQIVGGLAIATLVLVSVAFGAEKDIPPDQKPNARWEALLDSIIVEVHEQFLLEHKAELDSLKRKEAIRYIKKRLLKAASAKSRARMVLYVEKKRSGDD